MEYKCSVCGHKIPGDLIVYINHTENHVVEEIKKDHPHWVEANGLCPQCRAYYRGEMKGGFMAPPRCAGRRKKIKNFLKSLLGLKQS